MVNDHLSDAVTRIRNAYRAGLPEVTFLKSKKILSALEVLSRYKYIGQVSVTESGIQAKLHYENKQPVILGIRVVSKPGQRIYAPYKNFPKVWGGLGMNILSTSKGIMAQKDAHKAKLGGEVLIQVW